MHSWHSIRNSTWMHVHCIAALMLCFLLDIQHTYQEFLENIDIELFRSHDWNKDLWIALLKGSEDFQKREREWFREHSIAERQWGFSKEREREWFREHSWNIVCIMLLNIKNKWMKCNEWWYNWNVSGVHKA